MQADIIQLKSPSWSNIRQVYFSNEETMSLLSYQHKRISIADKNGVLILKISTILYIHAQSSYSYIYLKNGEKFLTSKTLKYWQNKISNTYFLRCHNSYLVNTRHVENILYRQGELCIGNELIPIARAKKNEVIRFFE
jgi:two-component system LytT family response regulator